MRLLVSYSFGAHVVENIDTSSLEDDGEMYVLSLMLRERYQSMTLTSTREDAHLNFDARHEFSRSLFILLAEFIPTEPIDQFIKRLRPIQINVLECLYDATIFKDSGDDWEANSSPICIEWNDLWGHPQAPKIRVESRRRTLRRLEELSLLQLDGWHGGPISFTPVGYAVAKRLTSGDELAFFSRS